MSLLNTDLSYYGFRIIGVNYEVDEYVIALPNVEPPKSTTMTLKSPNTSPVVRAEQMMSDLEVMSKVRSSMDPAVKEAYEQMLTVMALTNGRVHDDEYGNTTTK